MIHRSIVDYKAQRQAFLRNGWGLKARRDQNVIGVLLKCIVFTESALNTSIRMAIAAEHVQGMPTKVVSYCCRFEIICLFEACIKSVT
uniref:AlNc14C4G582 protein n=1 Tax=Albugo laibachii Nc14 TaxID=890382 RepID=F0W0D9_9STRA|nr:AlNc14C4G582 [Albugo laibachii Nc14]|eukprot:CCA14511.1 AlNc14C4G582 [Albugo laibachii Nc14]